MGIGVKEGCGDRCKEDFTRQRQAVGPAAHGSACECPRESDLHSPASGPRGLLFSSSRIDCSGLRVSSVPQRFRPARLSGLNGPDRR